MLAKIRLVAIRLSAISALVMVFMGMARAQVQTNANIHGKPDQDAAKQVAPARTDNLTSGDSGSYTPPDTATKVGAIPPEETKVLQRRREAKRFTTAGFGPAGFGNIDEKAPAYDVYAGKIWEVDRHAAIKGLAEVASDLTRASIAELNLGANLYLLPTDFSPYLGGAMGLTFGSVPGDRAMGMNLGASLGALLFRTSNAQLNLEGNAQMMLTELNHEKPSIFSARLGVLF